MKSALGVLFVVALACALAGGYVVWRRRVAGAWREAARRLGCAWERGGALRPGAVSGPYRGRDLHLASAVSYEDGPGYRHTAAAVPIRNPGQFILGARRRSLLEQMNARKEAKAAIETDDPDFDALFLLVCNDSAHVETALNRDVRDQMKRLSELEAYVYSDRVSVRRAGELRQAKELIELADLACDLADAVAALPARPRTLSEKLADEALIEKGV